MIKLMFVVVITFIDTASATQEHVTFHLLNIQVNFTKCIALLNLLSLKE